MKKLLIALVLGLLLVAALATVASADNGPHGGFTATTDACASCHRAHSAKIGSNALLKEADVEALCLSCHDGSGAGTNVVDGTYGTGTYSLLTTEGMVGRSLFGGGFTNAKMATTWSGAVTANAAFDATSKPTTSHHVLGGTSTVWGSGANNSVNETMTLECTSCHTPHGNDGFTNATTQTTVCNPTLAAASPTTEACTKSIASYRLLRWQPTGSNGFTSPGSVNWSGGAFPVSGTTSGWTVPDNFAANGTEWYTIGTTGAFAVGDYNAGNANNTYNPTGVAGAAKNYIQAGINVAYFCAQCHDRYFNGSSLRNNTDASAYCYGGVARGWGATPATGALADPTGATSVSTVDPVNCKPFNSRIGPTGTPTLWHWGDASGSGDNVYTYRHTSGDIRVSSDGQTAAGAGTSISRACIACHVAHGTTASMTALASSATFVTGGVGGLDNSILLRMDNRSLCLRCHAGTGFGGFVPGP